MTSKKESVPFDGWMCGRCRRMHGSKLHADGCCAPSECARCEVTMGYGRAWSMCKVCREWRMEHANIISDARALKRATAVVSLAEYEGEMLFVGDVVTHAEETECDWAWGAVPDGKPANPSVSDAMVCEFGGGHFDGEFLLFVDMDPAVQKAFDAWWKDVGWRCYTETTTLVCVNVTPDELRARVAKWKANQ